MLTGRKAETSRTRTRAESRFRRSKRCRKLHSSPSLRQSLVDSTATSSSSSSGSTPTLGRSSARRFRLRRGTVFGARSTRASSIFPSSLSLTSRFLTSSRRSASTPSRPRTKQASASSVSTSSVLVGTFEDSPSVEPSPNSSTITLATSLWCSTSSPSSSNARFRSSMRRRRRLIHL